ncbi:MAG: guanitoxin biosynthesis heme-dependent pre-guanitoxin N-hydroxylase GntA [Dehalococcoidia bacterium]
MTVRESSVAGANPFDSDLARKHSNYSAPTADGLVLVDGGEPAPAVAARVHDALRALVLDPEYPCVGSRSAFNQDSYRFAHYPELASIDATAGLARDLLTFVREQPQIEGQFTTFIATFAGPKALDDKQFESLLWEQLRLLHAEDRKFHAWDPEVASDPSDRLFSFSFGGRAYFVVGLSPAAERWARHFPWPTLAFNAHYQFEELRASGQFERVQEVVRDRDRELQGDTNPNLADFGEHTEARQYSGRPVGHDWRCPVSFEL